MAFNQGFLRSEKAFVWLVSFLENILFSSKMFNKNNTLDVI